MFLLFVVVAGIRGESSCFVHIVAGDTLYVVRGAQGAAVDTSVTCSAPHVLCLVSCYVLYHVLSSCPYVFVKHSIH